jgi:acyl carrier protein|tara:strand:+ start:228 stop:473 length:246 start_codon:yes stop_codon:yes gene_type:complete
MQRTKIDIKKDLLLILKSLNKSYVKIPFKNNFFFEGFDSLDYLNLIFKIQKKYKIEINNKELNRLKKLDEIILLILKKEKK